MITKGKRLGRDPLEERLGWIKDSRKGAEVPQPKTDTLGRLRPSPRVITKSTQKGTKEGWIRATYIVREEFVEEIKEIAYQERRLIKDLIDEALEAYLKKKAKKKRPKLEG
jgi:hypothetical protein